MVGIARTSKYNFLGEGPQPFVYVARPEQVIVISEKSPAENKELLKLLCN